MNKQYTSKDKYKYHFNICQNGYSGKQKNKSVSYSSGFCDGYTAEFPNVNNDSRYYSGKEKSKYSLGYYNGLVARFPNYRNTNRTKRNYFG